MLGMEDRALCIAGKHSTNRERSQPRTLCVPQAGLELDRKLHHALPDPYFIINVPIHSKGILFDL